VRSLDEYVARLFGTSYVWGALAISVAALGFLSLCRRSLRAQRVGKTCVDARAAMVLLAAFALVNSWALAVQWPTGDEPHYLLITQSLLYDGDFDLRNNYERGQYALYYPPLQPLAPHVASRDGRWYPWHGVGLPIVSAPFFAVAGRPGVVALLTVVTVAGLALLWSALVRARFTPVVASQAVLVAGFTLPVASLSAQVFGEIPAFLLVSTALRAVFARPPARGDVAAIAVGLALLPWLHAKYVLIAAGLLVLVVLRWGRSVARLAIAVPALALGVSTAALAVLSGIWYGVPVPGAQFLADGSLGNPVVGLPGVLFDQQAGLFVASPVYVLALPGLVLLWRRDPRLTMGVGLVIGVVYVLAGTHVEWYGGEASPARYITPAVPLLAVALAALLRDGSPAAQRAFAVLEVPSFGVALLLLAMPAGHTRYGDPATHHSFFIAVVERAAGLDLTWLVPSFRSLEPVVWLTTAVYLLGVVWITKVFARIGSAPTM
jgi:hypothetical protein